MKTNPDTPQDLDTEQRQFNERTIPAATQAMGFF
jgi:hypothetical protein